MPQNNLRIILFFGLFCVVCSMNTTLRDRILLHSLREVESLSLVKPTKEQLFEGAMEGMLAKMHELGDPYSAYISPGEQEEQMNSLNSKIQGIGVRFDPTASPGKFRILYPLLHSPAYRAGIRCGDRILKVNGENTDFWDFETLFKNIKGLSGTQVVLTIVHQDEEQARDISIERASIQQDTVFGYGINEKGEKIVEIPDMHGIGYVYIASFNDQTAREMVELLQTLPPRVERLILDLRGNPGGYLNTAVEVANLFVDDKGPYREIVTTRLRNGTVRPGERYFATPDRLYGGELLVLIDGESASAAEILAACLQDFARARILGQRTYGKGTVQGMFQLPINSGMIKLTNASYWRPSGKNINRIRRIPKIENGTPAKISEESDDWGVSPDPGLNHSLPKEQSFLVRFFRDIRTCVPREQAEPLCDEYLPLLKKEAAALLQDHDSTTPDVESKTDDESKTTTAKEFQPEGKAPYYDPVLDQAIKLLEQPPATPKNESREL